MKGERLVLVIKELRVRLSDTINYELSDPSKNVSPKGHAGYRERRHAGK